LIGIAYLLALLFAVQDIASVQATTFAIPIAQLFYDAVGPRLSQMCLLVIMVSQVMAAITTFTASSRLFYALARDNAFPLKKQFMTLNRFQAPYWGVWTSVLIGCIISCAYIGSAIAVSRSDSFMYLFILTAFALSQFNAILSSAAISVMLSYMQPIIIRVFWPDSFVINNDVFEPHLTCFHGFSIQEFGPFRLGKWSWPVNFASFLVRDFFIYHTFPFIIHTVHYFRLCFVHPAYGIPGERP
jgi:amino acid transporter